MALLDGRLRSARGLSCGIAAPAALLAALLAAALCPSAGRAAAGAASVETSVSARSVEVGDTVRLNLKVTWSEGTEVKPLLVAERLGDFVVRDVFESAAPAAAGAPGREISLVLAAFETGTKTIPPVRLVYIGPDGAVGELESSPVEIDVRSVLPEDAADIRDIKPPLSVPRRWKDLILSYALIVGLTAAAAASVLVSFKRRDEIQALLARTWRRLAGPLARLLLRLLALIGLRRRPQAEAFGVRVDEPGLPPGEAALREIARIEALGLAGRGMIVELYTLVSETVRRFVERRYDVLAMESPTSHTLAALAGRGLAERPLAMLADLLSEADLVKFARHRPAGDRAAGLVERARAVVLADGTGAAESGVPAGPAEGGRQ